MSDTPIADQLSAPSTDASGIPVTAYPEHPLSGIVDDASIASSIALARTFVDPNGITVDADGTFNIPLAPVQPAPTISTPDAVVNTVPTVSISADGVPHVTLPLTKKTKSNVGTAVGVVTTAAVLAAGLLPPDVAGWIQVGVGIVGAAATWLGIYLPTNLPIKIGKK